MRENSSPGAWQLGPQGEEVGDCAGSCRTCTHHEYKDLQPGFTTGIPFGIKTELYQRQSQKSWEQLSIKAGHNQARVLGPLRRSCPGGSRAFLKLRHCLSFASHLGDLLGAIFGLICWKGEASCDCSLWSYSSGISLSHLSPGQTSCSPQPVTLR